MDADGWEEQKQTASTLTPQARSAENTNSVLCRGGSGAVPCTERPTSTYENNEPKAITEQSRTNLTPRPVTSLTNVRGNMCDRCSKKKRGSGVAQRYRGRGTRTSGRGLGCAPVVRGDVDGLGSLGVRRKFGARIGCRDRWVGAAEERWTGNDSMYQTRAGRDITDGEDGGRDQGELTNACM